MLSIDLARHRSPRELRTEVSAVGLESLSLIEIEAIVGIDQAPHHDDVDVAPWRTARLVLLGELLVTIAAMHGASAADWLRSANPRLGYRSPLSLLMEEPEALPVLCRALRDEARA